MFNNHIFWNYYVNIYLNMHKFQLNLLSAKFFSPIFSPNRSYIVDVLWCPLCGSGKLLKMGQLLKINRKVLSIWAVCPYTNMIVCVIWIDITTPPWWGNTPPNFSNIFTFLLDGLLIPQLWWTISCLSWCRWATRGTLFILFVMYKKIF